MSCQRVLEMLSTYVDGEAQAEDAAFIREHLAGCASCTREIEQLQRTVEMLKAASEIEPPAFLLERIEAATVNRPTFWERIQAGFSISPIGARLAAGTALAGVLVAALLFQLGEHGARKAAVGPESGGTVVVQSSARPAELSPTQPGETSRSIESRGSVQRRAVVARSPVRKVATAKHKFAKGVGTSGQAAEADIPGEEISVAEASDTSNADAAGQSKIGVEEARLAKALAYQEARLKQESDALAEVRAKLAARNKQRSHDAYVEKIEGRGCSVALASIRF